MAMQTEEEVRARLGYYEKRKSFIANSALDAIETGREISFELREEYRAFSIRIDELREVLGEALPHPEF